MTNPSGGRSESAEVLLLEQTERTEKKPRGICVFDLLLAGCVLVEAKVPILVNP